MKVVEKSIDINVLVDNYKKQGLIVGFVPTMGALHEGHLSLIKKAAEQVDIVIVSIFVNPTQFNNPDDLKKYPRTFDEDYNLLKDTACAVLYYPTVEEVYPDEDKRVFDFGNVDKVMEGSCRPGHFIGVAQVVSRFFDLIKPDKAFFGEKDFQQIAVINKMVQQLNYNIEIVSCPIIRDDRGLAKSSRNKLLTKACYEAAPLIAEKLFESKKLLSTRNIKEVINFVTEEINQSGILEVEYFEIVDGYSLQPIDNWSDSDFIVGCIAVYADKVRLIDNLIYKKLV